MIIPLGAWSAPNHADSTAHWRIAVRREKKLVGMGTAARYFIATRYVQAEQVGCDGVVREKEIEACDEH